MLSEDVKAESEINKYIAVLLCLAPTRHFSSSVGFCLAFPKFSCVDLLRDYELIHNEHINNVSAFTIGRDFGLG